MRSLYLASISTAFSAGTRRTPRDGREEEKVISSALSSKRLSPSSFRPRATVKHKLTLRILISRGKKFLFFLHVFKLSCVPLWKCSPLFIHAISYVCECRMSSPCVLFIIFCVCQNLMKRKKKRKNLSRNIKIYD